MKNLFIAFLFVIITNSILNPQSFKLIGPPNRYGILEFQKNNPNILYIANGWGALTRSINDGKIKEILHPGFGAYTGQLSLLNTDTSTIFFNSNEYLLKSYDTGENWTYDDGVFFYPAFVFVNPLNDNIIYKYKDKQIFKSYNKGNSWNYLFAFPYSTLYPTIIMSPADTSIVYIALKDNGNWFRLFKSLNAGNDWTEVSHNGNVPAAYKIDINPNNPKSLYIQLGGGVFKSLDGGETFTQIGPTALLNFTLDHQDTLTLYFISRDPFYHPYGLFAKTTNEGQTWFNLNESFPDYVFFDNMVINPLDHNEIYVFCDIGTYKSTDGGANWKEVYLAGEYAVDYYVDSNTANKIITTNSLFGFKMTTDGGDSWFIPGIDEPLRYAGRTAHYFAFSPDNPDIGFLTTDSLVYQTTDGGFNWFKNSFPKKFANTIAISPVDPNIILICTIYSPEGGAKLYLSSDGGENWELRKDLGGWYFGFEQMVCNPVDVNKVYLKMRQGDSLLVSTDLGLNWSNAGFGLSNNALINQIWINPGNPLEIYCSEKAVGVNPGTLSISSNGGESWHQIDSALKLLDEYCNVQAFWIDPENTNRMYVGLGEHSQFPASGGIYFSDNDGQSWMKIFDSYADKIKADNSTPRKLYFNTKFGLLTIRDTLVTDVTEQLQLLPNEFELEQNYPNPFNPSTKINYSLKVAGQVVLKVYDILGREIVTILNEYRPAGKYEINWNAANLPSGVYIYRLQAGSYVSTKKMMILK